MTTYTNRVYDEIVEALPAEVWGGEHPASGQTFVNWKRVFTSVTTRPRKCEIYLDILLQTFLFDSFFQLKLM